MKIGIIGAENTHSDHFCKTINEQKQFPEHRIEYLYGGDAPKHAEEMCAQYGMELCGSEEELIEKSDAVVITYRRGSEHFTPAMKVLKAGKPLFNDKPFTNSSEQTKALIDYAAEHNSLVCGGSNLKGLPGLPELKSLMGPGRTAVITFGADADSIYDGYWFYGIHSAELCITLCGENFSSVSSYRNGDSVITVVNYPDRNCVISTHPGNHDLHISIAGEGETVHRYLPLNYQDVGPGEFVRMAESKILPRPLSFYLAATRLTEEIIKLKS